jgi:predicted nuclease of predicted toxin-antitoxin system
MLGQPDHKVFQRAFDENYILITANQRDFEKLASNTELHCGLIIIEDGETTRNEQLEILLIALEKIQQEYDDGRDLANRIFYINSLLEWRFETNPTDE